MVRLYDVTHVRFVAVIRGCAVVEGVEVRMRVHIVLPFVTSPVSISIVRSTNIVNIYRSRTKFACIIRPGLLPPPPQCHIRPTPTPTTDIWWSPLETYSNLFTWRPTPTLTATDIWWSLSRRHILLDCCLPNKMSLVSKMQFMYQEIRKTSKSQIFFFKTVWLTNKKTSIFWLIYRNNSVRTNLC